MKWCRQEKIKKLENKNKEMKQNVLERDKLCHHEKKENEKEVKLKIEILRCGMSKKI